MIIIVACRILKLFLVFLLSTHLRKKHMFRSELFGNNDIQVGIKFNLNLNLI